MRHVGAGLAIVLALSLALPHTALSEPTPDAGASDASEASDASAVQPSDVVHFSKPAHIITASGLSYPLAPGYYVPSDKWVALDAELARLQNVETRLGTENKSLRAANNNRPWALIKLSLYSIGAGVVIGAVGYWYVFRR